MAAYLKKILKTGGRREVNGSDATTPHKSSGSVPDLLMGVDVSSPARNKSLQIRCTVFY